MYVAHTYIQSPTRFGHLANQYGKTRVVRSDVIQNQISIQRCPSTAKGHVSALSRQISVKSSRNYDENRHSVTGVPSANAEEPRERGDSNSSLLVLLRYDRKSRHRKIKRQRRYECLAARSIWILG